MRRTMLALSILLAVSAAHATKPTPPATTPTQSQHVGITTVAAGLGLGVGTGGAGGAGYGTGGVGQVLGSGNGTGYGGTLDLAGAKFGGDTIVPKQAPSVSMTAPQQPIASCRLGVSLFGSSSGGGGGGGIPIANDQTCLAGAKLAAMERAGGFSVESKQRVACTIEGMADLRECKALSERRAEVEPARQVSAAPLELLP